MADKAQMPAAMNEAKSGARSETTSERSLVMRVGVKLLLLSLPSSRPSLLVHSHLGYLCYARPALDEITFEGI